MKRLQCILFLLILYFTVLGIAFADNRYVSTQGMDPEEPTGGCCADPENPCRTIALAIRYSGAYNDVLVAKGTYTDEKIQIGNILGKIIQGGWNEAFTEKTTDPSLTNIQGNGTDDVFDIGGLNISNLTIDNFTITNPTASGSGINGVYLKSYNPYTVTVTLKNLIIKNAGTAGLRIWTQNYGIVNATLENSMISANHTYEIYASASGSAPDYDMSTINLDITNATIANNGGITSYGVCLRAWYEGQVNAHCWNSILWGHQDSAGKDLDIDGPDDWPDAGIAVTASYCDIGTVSNEGGDYTEGTGVISDAPMFINPSNGNCHIKGGSPCRNTGIYGKKVCAGGTWFVYDYSFIPDEDFEGDERNSEWVEGPANTFHKYCDMGADEFTQSALPWMPLLLLD